MMRNALLWRRLFLCCAVLLFSTGAFAQAPGQNNETQRRQEQLEQAQPTPQTGPQQDLVIGPEYSNPDAPAPAAGPRFPLMAIQVDPSNFISRSEIDPILQPYVGNEVDFADLAAIVGRLNALYREKGQITARAFLPPQRIENGVVHIALIEGKIGAITVEGARTTRESYVRGALPLMPGSIVDANELSRAVLFFNRTNSTQLRVVLNPGAEFGQTDLTLAVQEVPANDFQIFFDNEGAESTGREEGGLFYHHNGLLGRDDRLTVFGLWSNGGLTGNLSYNVPVDMSGDRVQVSYQRDQISIVEGPNRALNITGHGQTGTLGFTHPFIANQNWIVTGEISGSGGTTATKSPSSVISDSTTYRAVANVSLTYIADPVIVSFSPSLSYAHNHDAIVSKDRDLALFSATAYAAVQLGGGRSLQLNAVAQYSSADLLPPDLLFQIGGPSSIRGYAVGAVAGDSGYYADVELHQDLGERLKHMDLFVFSDNGAVYSTQPSYRALNSAGAGFVMHPDPMTISVTAGFPLRTELPGQKSPAIYARASMRL